MEKIKPSDLDREAQRLIDDGKMRLSSVPREVGQASS